MHAGEELGFSTFIKWTSQNTDEEGILSYFTDVMNKRY